VASGLRLTIAAKNKPECWEGNSLRVAKSRRASGRGYAVVGALMSLLLASCTSSNDPGLDLVSPALNGTPDPAAVLVQPGPLGGAMDTAAQAAPEAAVSGEALPEKVAYLPVSKPEAGFPVGAAGQAAAAVAAEAEAADAPKADAAEAKQAAPAAAGADTAAVAADESPTADREAEKQLAAAPKKSVFASLFSKRPDAGSPMVSPRGGDRAPAKAVIKRGLPKPVLDEAAPAPELAETTKPTAFIENLPPKAFVENIPAKPLVEPQKPARQPIVLASYGGGDNGLPGVRQSALFEIKRKSGLDDDSDVDLHEEDDYGAPIRLASAAGLARLAPNGLLTQTEDVDVACLKPSLVRVLKSVEQRFGRRLIVTSGYRSRIRNIKARGAKNSLHMYCAAADIQVPGVGKLQLASFLRAIPGRGGVGTYCHTNSVHVDVGPERDWNWRCGRRKKA